MCPVEEKAKIDICESDQWVAGFDSANFRLDPGRSPVKISPSGSDDTLRSEASRVLCSSAAMRFYRTFQPTCPWHPTYPGRLLRDLCVLAIFRTELCDMRTKTFSQPIKGSKKRALGHPASKAPGARGPAAHIMAAPKGPRTVSHRRIAEAIDKVFRERTMTHG